jgi:chromate transporter
MPEGAASAPAAPAAPRSSARLFWVFTRLALQGFGGVLPIAQRELVERERWLDQQQFLQALSLAQVLPGPNVVNLALMVGDRFFGWRGALAAMAGMLCLPTVLVLVLAALAAQVREWPAVAGALRGMGIVAAGLVVATALKLLGGLRGNPLPRPWLVLIGGAALLAVGVLRWPLAWAVLALGGLAVAGAAWTIRR